MKINKGLFTVLILSAISATSFAQFTKCKVADIEKLKQDGTVVVAISNNDEVNKLVEEVMKSNWTLSKYKVIKELDLKAYEKENPKNYVLTYIDISTSVVRAASSFSSTKSYLVLLKDCRANRDITSKNFMAYSTCDQGLDALNKQAELMREIGALNSALTYPNLKNSQLNGLKITTHNQQDVITKELWIAEQDLKKEVNVNELNVEYAPYVCKIVAKAEIVNAILEKKRGVVYLSNGGINLFLIHNPEEHNKAVYYLPVVRGMEPKYLKKIKLNKTFGQ